MRKEIAEREGIPVYTIFTNQQLADMVTARVSTSTEIGKIKGVGKSRIEKYAAEFLAEMQTPSPATGTPDEKSDESVSEDSWMGQSKKRVVASIQGETNSKRSRAISQQRV